MFNKLYTGGACGDGQQQQGRGQNAMNKFLNEMLTGPGQSRQGKGGFVYDQPEGEAHLHGQDMRRMEQEFGRMNMGMNMNMMNQGQQIRPGGEEGWVEEFNKPGMARPMGFHPGPNMMMARPYMYQHHMAPQMMGGQNTGPQIEEIKAEEKKEDTKKQEEIEGDQKDMMKQTAGEMADILSKDPDEKMQKSDFLNFLKGVSTGSLEVDTANNTVVDKGTKVEETTAVKEEIKVEDDSGSDLDEEQIKESMKEFWENEEFKQNLANIEKMFQEGWQDAWQEEDPLGENAVETTKELKYDFAPQNPFEDTEDPFGLALKFREEGKITEAILALEAQLHKTPDRIECWQLLGTLHADNDQDKEAIACHLKSIEIDPQNLESLLRLGISCANEFDAQTSMKFLKQWLECNPQFKDIPGVMDPIHGLDKMGMHAKVVDIFNKCIQSNPRDSDCWLALGVLNFIPQDYDAAAECFRNALRERPSEYSMWNKLGATLANNYKVEPAMRCYHQALELNPTYVRGWTNLAIAHGNNSDHQVAAGFYLNALSLNPDALHLWNRVQTCFLCMNRYDLVERIKDHDVNAFRDEFNIISLETLPKPSRKTPNVDISYPMGTRGSGDSGPSGEFEKEFQEQSAKNHG